MKKLFKKIVEKFKIKKINQNKIKKHKKFAFHDGTVNDYEGGIWKSSGEKIKFSAFLLS